MNYSEPGQGTGVVLLTKVSDPHGEVMVQRRPSPIPTGFIQCQKMSI